MTSMPLPGGREQHPPETVGGQHQSSFIPSWREHGRREQEKEGDKAEELESSILPLPRQENQCGAFIYQVTLAIATIVINFAMLLNIDNEFLEWSYSLAP